mmetsp:Transcript_10182/g.28572  ORF Transcript_10182/g.28572 Transcript_10182/m.28572 type:complete len:219 (+) Transcript_10182:1166-1822(+)
MAVFRTVLRPVPSVPVWISSLAPPVELWTTSIGATSTFPNVRLPSSMRRMKCSIWDSPRMWRSSLRVLAREMPRRRSASSFLPPPLRGCRRSGGSTRRMSSPSTPPPRMEMEPLVPPRLCSTLLCRSPPVMSPRGPSSKISSPLRFPRASRRSSRPLPMLPSAMARRMNMRTPSLPLRSPPRRRRVDISTKRSLARPSSLWRPSARPMSSFRAASSSR